MNPIKLLHVDSPISLVAINARYTHTNIALRYFRNAWLDFEPQRRIILAEFTINQNYLDILEQIVANQPALIAFSVYIWNMQIVQALLQDLEQLLPNTDILLGGPEPAWNHTWWVNRFPAIKGISSTSAESTVQALFETNFQWPQDKAIQAKPIPFSTVPSAWNTSEIAELSSRYIYYESSRGCPFACSYCISSRDDQNLDAKPLDQVLGELSTILAHEPLLLKFVDRSFNADPQRARAIWLFLLDWLKTHPGKIRQSTKTSPDIRRRPPQIEATRFHFEIQAALIEQADLDILAKVPNKSFQFEMGVQSTERSTLMQIGRKVPIDKTLNGIAQIIKLGTVHSHVDMIVGLPGESLVHIGHSFDQIIALGADHFQVGFLKALYGTDIQAEAQSKEMIFSSIPPYQILCSPTLSTSDLASLRRAVQLMENLWEPNNLRPEFDQFAAKVHPNASRFQAFLALENFARQINFDCNTRHTASLLTFLEAAHTALLSK